MQFTGNLADLIATVEKEFSAEMAKSENASSAASLKKAEDEKKDKKPSDSKPAEGKDKAPAAEAKPSEEGAPEAPAAEGDAPAPAMEGAPAPAAAAPPGADPAMAAGQGSGYDEEDMEHMRQMYASMSQEELMAHHDAIRDALDACSAAPAPGAAAPAPGAPAPGAPAPGQDPMMGKSEGNKKGHSELSQENPELNSKPKAGGQDMNNDPKNGGIEAAPPGNPVGARSEASKDSKNLHDAMTKTERERRNGGKIEASPVRNSPGAKSPASKAEGNQMEKSENIGNDLQKSLEASEAKNAELKKSLDTVQEFLTKLVTKVSAPKGKAVTEIASLAKNEDGGTSVDTNSMSKSEITQRLLQKSSDPRTSAQDRAAINAYYLSNANVNTISHLLK